MSDRYEALIVVLDKDIRVEDVQPLSDAISMMKGVVSVSGVVPDFGSHVARSRANSNLVEKLIEIINELRQQ